MNLFLQLLGNGLVQGAVAMLYAAGFGIVYRSFRVFHIAMGAQFVFSCYAFYTCAADISNRKTFPRMYTTSPTKICSPGDILISVRAPVGTVARSTISACIGRGICSIRPKRMSDYIYEYLLYYEDKWGRVSQGSTFESISGDDIGKLSIPQHHESDQVAKMLTFAGKEIDLLSQDIEQEKRKKKALMQLLLTGIVRVNV